MSINKLSISDIFKYLDLIRVESESERLFIFEIISNVDDHWVKNASKTRSDT